MGQPIGCGEGRDCGDGHRGLVNIVRRPEHIDLLKALGARHVCNSSAETFLDDLTDALVDTGATLAFVPSAAGDWPSRS